jgi:hypothetical protein
MVKLSSVALLTFVYFSLVYICLLSSVILSYRISYLVVFLKNFNYPFLKSTSLTKFVAPIHGPPPHSTSMILNTPLWPRLVESALSGNKNDSSNGAYDFIDNKQINITLIVTTIPRECKIRDKAKSPIGYNGI